MRALALCLLLIPWSARAQEPPPRPSQESVQSDARLLFEAIARDDPALAEAFFFPREAFSRVKAIAHPERYWDKLHARYLRDVHALHAQLPPGAQFVRLELGRRGGYVRPGEEGNHLPYWAARHAMLHYRVGERDAQLEVRVLISWEGRWHLIHLSEFH